MNKYRFKKLIFPTFVFLIFVFLLIYEEFYTISFKNENLKLLNELFIHAIKIGFWISGAHLFNVLLRIFFWDAIVSKTIHGEVPRLLIHFFSLVVYLITVMISVGHVFHKPLTGLWATSGLMALILGFALRNMILDLFTGLAVNIERPYKIGDWIEIKMDSPAQNIFGEIIDINWRATRLRSEEDKIVILPNSLLNTFILTKYTTENVKVRFETEIRLDSSYKIERAKRIIEAAANKVLKENGFFEYPKASVIVNKANEFGVNYLVRYWINPWKGIYPAQARDKINSAIFEYLSFSGIKPSFPKQEVYYSKLPPRITDATSNEYRLQLLNKVSLFSCLESEEIEELANLINHRMFPKGTNIIKLGEPGDSMFILGEGLLEVKVKGINGGEHVVGEIFPGQFFGEMSLLTGEPRSATITAVTDVIVFEIAKDDVENLFRRRASLLEDISQIVAERRASNIAAIESLSAQQTEQHIDNFAQNLLKNIRRYFL